MTHVACRSSKAIGGRYSNFAVHYNGGFVASTSFGIPVWRLFRQATLAGQNCRRAGAQAASLDVAEIIDRLSCIINVVLYGKL